MIVVNRFQAGWLSWNSCHILSGLHVIFVGSTPSRDLIWLLRDKLLGQFLVFLERTLRHGISNKLPHVANADGLPQSEEQGALTYHYRSVCISNRCSRTCQLRNSGEVIFPLLVSVSLSANGYMLS